MDLLQEHTGVDLAGAPFGSSDESIVSLPPSQSAAGDDPAGAVLELVQEAASVLRSSEDHSAEIEARARELSDRAVEQLKRAKEHIAALEWECEKCNALIAQGNARAAAAEDALKKFEDQFGAIELQMSATEFRARSAEARATKAEDMLRRVEEAIRSQILEPQRSRKIISAAAA
jgi:chromosome segregation ATPase